MMIDVCSNNKHINKPSSWHVQAQSPALHNIISKFEVARPHAAVLRTPYTIVLPVAALYVVLPTSHSGQSSEVASGSTVSR